MNKSNRNVIGIVVILALLAVAIFDRSVFFSLFNQALGISEFVFFVTATLWLLKHW